MSEYPTQRLPIQHGNDGGHGGLFDEPEDRYSRAPRRRRRRWPLVLIIIVVVLAALFVVADRVAVHFADNEFASQIQKQGFSSKPDVTIQGFPFLTQLAARDFKDVHITATGEKTGPVTIDHINATLKDIKLNSGFSSGTVSSINGTGLITFGSLAKAGSSAAGVANLKIARISNNEAKITADVAGIFSGSGVARVTESGDKIHVKLISAGGIPTSVLGGLGNFTIPLPNLPMGMTLQNITLTSQGALVHITGHNITFGN
ncbi:MAG: LmeA family phospholipid-binding protein [Streptosporangiaceae bacterium]